MLFFFVHIFFSRSLSVFCSPCVCFLFDGLLFVCRCRSFIISKHRSIINLKTYPWVTTAYFERYGNPFSISISSCFLFSNLCMFLVCSPFLFNFVLWRFTSAIKSTEIHLDDCFLALRRINAAEHFNSLPIKLDRFFFLSSHDFHS